MWLHLKYIYSMPGHHVPPVNMSSTTNQLIITFLQNGKSIQQVADQLHVSYCTVWFKWFTKPLVTASPGSLVDAQQPLQPRTSNPCVKVTFGAADNASQLKRLLCLNVTDQTVRNALKNTGCRSSVKQKSPFFQRLIGGGLWSPSTGLWMTGAVRWDQD